MSWSDCWKRSLPTPLGHQDVVIIVIVIVIPRLFFYQKVIYNIGIEIIMLHCDLHNSTQEAPTELSFSGICTKFRDEQNGIGPSAVAIALRKILNFAFCSMKIQKKTYLMPPEAK